MAYLAAQSTVHAGTVPAARAHTLLPSATLQTALLNSYSNLAAVLRRSSREKTMTSDSGAQADPWDDFIRRAKHYRLNNPRHDAEE